MNAISNVGIGRTAVQPMLGVGMLRAPFKVAEEVGNGGDAR